MDKKCLNSRAQRLLTKEDHSVQGLGFLRTEEPLGVGVQLLRKLHLIATMCVDLFVFSRP